MIGSKLLKPWQFARSDLKATLGNAKENGQAAPGKGVADPLPGSGSLHPKAYGAPMNACGRFVLKPEKIKTTGNLCGPYRPSSRLTERNSRAFLQKQESLVVCRCMLHEMEASLRYGPVSLDRSSTCGNFFEVFHLNVQW